jgi:hypothetical protein
MKTAPFTFGSEIWPGVAKLIEEAGEVLQICGKLMSTNGEDNYWEDRNIHADFQDELADLQAALSWVIEENQDKLDLDYMTERLDLKQELFDKWHADGDDPR